MSVLPTHMPRLDNVPAIFAIAFRPASGRSALIGYADFHLAKVCMRLLNCPVFDTRPVRRVGLPSAPQIDTERRALMGSDSKVLHRPCLEFGDPQPGRAFSDPRVAALLVYWPNAFDGGLR